MTALRTGAFLALWNGIREPALQAEYEAWHAFEHVPERVGSPGFVAAQRYVARSGATGQPAYFTLYELESLDALRTPRYQDLIDRPTAWSARMRGVLTDFCREPCAMGGSHGPSSAAQLATLQLRLGGAGQGDRLDACLRELVASGAALSARWGRAEFAGDHPLAKVAAPEGAQAVVLVHHVRHDLLGQAVAHLAGPAGPGLALRAAPGFYELQSAVRQADLPFALTARQPARPDLQQRFSSGDPA